MQSGDNSSRYRAAGWLVSFVALLALLTASGARGQQFDETQTGHTFIIAFPDTVGNLSDPRHPSVLCDTFALYIYSAVDNACTITGNGGYRRELDVKGGTFTTVWLDDAVHPSSDITVREVGEVSRSTFRIEAREPVFVICYLATRFGSEAWVPLPVERWGREYVAMAMPGDLVVDVRTIGRFDYEVQARRMAPALILVVASEDDTRVTLVRPRAFALHPRPNDTSVVLAAGEAYMFRTWVDTVWRQDAFQSDPTGARILASKPVAVASGNVRWHRFGDNVGRTFNSFRNILMEALTPTDQHGTEFLALPARDSRYPTGSPFEESAAKRTGEIVKVTGTSGSPITVTRMRNGQNLVDGPIGGDSSFSLRAQQALPQHIVTSSHSQAVSVPEQSVQLVAWFGDMGSEGAIYQVSSAWSVELTPLEQWVSFAPTIAPSYPDSMEHYVTLAADSSEARRIHWGDGRPFSFYASPIEGTRFVWGTEAVAAGSSHVLIGRDGARFGGMVHGIRPGREGTVLPPTVDSLVYLETVALSYGYPLAPARRQLRAPTRATTDASTPALSLNATSASDRITVHFSLPRTTRARVDLFDMLGRIVATLINDEREQGAHSVWITSEALPTGTYFCHLIAGGHTRTVRITR